MKRNPCLVRATVAALVALALAPAVSSAATPEYFPTPGSRGVNEGIVVDSAGDVWFAVNNTAFGGISELARLRPSQATADTSNGITYFPTPAASGEGCCVSLIRDLAFDPANGRIWFTRSAGAVGYAALSQMAAGTANGMQVARTPGGPDLGGIAVDGSGVAWYAERTASNVGPAYAGNRMAHTDSTLTIGELPDLWHQTGVPADASRYDAEPAGVTIAPDGSPWFAEANAGFPGYRLARVSGGLYQEWLAAPCQSPPLSCSGENTGTGLVSVAAAPNGEIWFTNILKNTFGRFDPTSSKFTQYSLPGIDPDLAQGQPRSIRLAPDGSLWLAEFGFISHPKANAIVRIVPTEPPTATVYKLGAGKAPLSVAADGSGNVWFAVNGDTSGFVGRLARVIGEQVPTGPTGSSTPVGGSGKSPPPPGAVVVKASGSGVSRVNDPTLRNGSLRLTQICVGPPEDVCSLVYLLDSHEYVSGLPGTKPRSGARRTRRVVVGSKAVSINGGESATVKIKLNAKGKKILARDGVLHLTFHASQKIGKGKTKVLKTKKLTLKAAGG